MTDPNEPTYDDILAARKIVKAKRAADAIERGEHLKEGDQ